MEVNARVLEINGAICRELDREPERYATLSEHDYCMACRRCSDFDEAMQLVGVLRDGTSLEDAAVAFAERAVAEQRPLAKIRDRDDKLPGEDERDALFADFRKSIARKTRGFLAPEYNVRCVEAAATKPFEEGLEIERTLVSEGLDWPQNADSQPIHKWKSTRQT